MTAYVASCGFLLASLPILLGAAEPSAVEPSAVESSAVEPSAVEPSAVQPSAVQPNFWRFLAEMGDVMALGMAALGSSIGIGLAGQAAAGAWAKEARAGRNLSFTYIILVGMPISQTLYAMIVMNNMRSVFANIEVTIAESGLLLGIGIATGMGEMLSAWMQGMIGAAGIRALSDGEGKGFAFVIIAMGIVETVGIFTMVFMLGMIPA